MANNSDGRGDKAEEDKKQEELEKAARDLEYCSVCYESREQEREETCQHGNCDNCQENRACDACVFKSHLSCLSDKSAPEHVRLKERTISQGKTMPHHVPSSAVAEGVGGGGTGGNPLPTQGDSDETTGKKTTGSSEAPTPDHVPSVAAAAVGSAAARESGSSHKTIEPIKEKKPADSSGETDAASGGAASDSGSSHKTIDPVPSVAAAAVAAKAEHAARACGSENGAANDGDSAADDKSSAGKSDGSAEPEGDKTTPTTPTPTTPNAQADNSGTEGGTETVAVASPSAAAGAPLKLPPKGTSSDHANHANGSAEATDNSTGVDSPSAAAGGNTQQPEEGNSGDGAGDAAAGGTTAASNSKNNSDTESGTSSVATVVQQRQSSVALRKRKRKRNRANQYALEMGKKKAKTENEKEGGGFFVLPGRAAAQGTYRTCVHDAAINAANELGVTIARGVLLSEVPPGKVEDTCLSEVFCAPCVAAALNFTWVKGILQEEGGPEYSLLKRCNEGVFFVFAYIHCEPKGEFHAFVYNSNSTYRNGVGGIIDNMTDSDFWVLEPSDRSSKAAARAFLKAIYKGCRVEIKQIYRVSLKEE